MAWSTLSMCFIAPFVFLKTIYGTTRILPQFLLMLLLMFLAYRMMKTIKEAKTIENIELTIHKLIITSS